MTDRELFKQALEALERSIGTCFDQRAHHEVMSRPEHFVNRAVTALRDRLAREDALNRMAENARELGLDYEPSGGTQVSKVWWDGDKLIAKLIPLEGLYKEPEHSSSSAIEELEHENRLMRARNERLQAEVERLEEQSEKRQYHADHVVLEKGTNDCVCTHCGQRYHIHMPVPMGIMTAILDAFLEAHHQCEKPEAA